MMKYFVFILILCGIFQKDVLGKRRHKTRNHNHHHHEKSHGSKIVGGNEAKIEDFAWQAYLVIEGEEEDDVFECGGSILSSYYILSAAHCFEGNIKRVSARIGSSNKFEGGREYFGTFEYHENYDGDTLDYDIAYFKSNKEMNLDGVRAKAVTLIEGGRNIPSGTTIKISGWGDTSEDGDDSDTLISAEVPTLSNEECNQDPIYGITVRQFCGGYKEGGKDHCEGDSGGPAVIADSNTLVGVISGGFACAKPDTPGIYVNITDPAIRSWITQHTGI